MILHITKLGIFLFLNYSFERFLKFNEGFESYNFDFKHGCKISKYKHTVNVNVASLNVF